MSPKKSKSSRKSLPKTRKPSQTKKPSYKKAPPRKPQNWILIVVLVLIAIVALVGITSIILDSKQAQIDENEISVLQTYEKYQQGVFLLDVRTLEEWQDYHIPNTTLIPLDELEARLDELPRDQEIVVVCRSGNRSKTARNLLLQAGFTNVTSMAGGLKEWRKLGYPLVSGT